MAPILTAESPVPAMVGADSKADRLDLKIEPADPGFGPNFEPDFMQILGVSAEIGVISAIEPSLPGAVVLTAAAASVGRYEKENSLRDCIISIMI